MFPQLAKEAAITSLQMFIENSEWVMEQKLDGHRLLLCSPGGDFPPTALTRNGGAYTRKLPQEIQDFRFPLKPDGTHYAAHEWILDGELVGTAVDGHTVSSTFWVFDIPACPLMDSPSSLPLHQRRRLLETFMLGVETPFKLVPQAKTRSQKIALSERALKDNFEGLLLKSEKALYSPGGRNPDWLKLKFVTTADCFVLAVRDDGKESVKLGVVKWTGPGILRDSYEVIEVGRASLIGKEKVDTIAVGDVLEVRYLYQGAGGRLYQPTILKKRDDKAMHECTVDQLKFVNKKVLESL